jgi:hypothetical protein
MADGVAEIITGRERRRRSVLKTSSGLLQRRWSRAHRFGRSRFDMILIWGCC